MWSLRMMQAVPGMALMAHGATRPLLLAGVLRAAAVLLSAVAAWRGLGLDWIAAAGCLGELASLAYVAWAAEQSESGLARPLVTRTALLLPAGLVAVLPLSLMPVEAGLGTTAAVTAMLLGLIVGAALAILPVFARWRLCCARHVSPTRNRPSRLSGRALGQSLRFQTTNAAMFHPGQRFRLHSGNLLS